MQKPEITKNAITAAAPLKELCNRRRAARRNGLVCGSVRMGYGKWLRNTQSARTKRMLEIGRIRFMAN
jgi:hypothetical protein